MPEYVYALHNFLPEHEDEIAFEAGQPIEVIEKDDRYNDGWWQGRNIAGKFGLFPQSYTTYAPPTGLVSTSSSASSSNPIVTPPDSHSPLNEEHDPSSLPDGESRIAIAIGEPDSAHGEVMKATMTDVQKAIEQLGKSDRDGAQSFSFSSTRDGDTDRETDGTETDGEIGVGWNRSARDKLAEKARKVVEAKAAEEAREVEQAHGRTSAPPIDVELSDESEAEEDDAAFHHLEHMHFTRDHPHIPEEDEEDAGKLSVAREPRRMDSNETSSVILPGDDLPSPEERTAKADQTSFPSTSSPPRFTRSPILNDRRSPKPRSPPATPDAIHIVAPVPVVPIGVHMIPKSTSPELAVRATPTPSVTRSVPAALPSPALTASGTRHHSRQPSNVSSTGKGSVGPSVLDVEANKKSTPPSEWTVDEVVEWLKSKGFGSDVYDKFIEQEITGDVLLELDINLLKAEIGIVAFGKRMRIANAIAELRRPPSIILPDHQPQHAQSITRSGSQHAHSPSESMQHSLSSPGLMSISTLVGGTGSLDSPRADFIPGSLIPRRVSSLSSAGASVNGGGSVEGAGGAVVAGFVLRTLTETRLASSPSESALVPPEQKPDETADEERGAQSEDESASTTSKVRRLLGLSVDSRGSGKDKDKDKERSETSGGGDKPPPSPTRTASPRIKLRNSQDDGNSATGPTGHLRLKRSMDTGKGTERHSLFGGAFTSSIRSRKPAPRVTSTLLEESSPTEKTSSLGLSRLYSSRKPSGRPTTSDGSVTSSLRNGMKSNNEGGDAKRREMERGKSFEKVKDQDKATPKVVPTELKDIDDAPRKPMQDGRAGSRGPNALKPGKSIIEQIGQPDHQGWMRKKGDRYNSWKLRFFIIKGPHLYILRSDSKAETKIKGYVNIVGYKVVADENIDPGRYGFRIVHETDKTHCFSSDEQAVVREWMKAIMKATIGRDYSKPVVSSVNIPTIPLTVAQAMNPAPRPPSPSARAATQKALRRENPNQLSTRDARVLMGLPSSDNARRIEDGVLDSERVRLEPFFANQPADANENGQDEGAMAKTPPKNAPPRPSREARRASASVHSLRDGTENNLVDWANSHLPRSLQMTELSSALFGGLALLRLAEDMMGKSASPPIPDSAFPSGPNDDKLDGLFRLFDFLLDNDVKMGAVSINDVRQGKRDKVMQLVKALKGWEDRRKEIVKSLGQVPLPAGGPLMGPVMGGTWLDRV